MALLYRTADFFSLETLVKTWFAPWKNDVLDIHNASLGDRVNVFEQNLASRYIGFFLRSVVILMALIVIGLFSILLIIGQLIWVMTPALIILLPLVAVYYSQ